MNRFKLIGNYGTFVISRVVDCDDEEGAFLQTGIMTTLQADGWTIDEWPDGETWEVVEVG